jgi:hypothetical protein
MKIARLFGGIAALCAFMAVAIIYAAVPARSFDLQGTPVLINRPAADIVDTYYFQSPANPTDVVLVMDVDPLLVPAPSSSKTAPTPAPGADAFFDQKVLYTMKFDTNYSSEATNARPIENYVLQFSFGAPTGPVGSQTQQVFVYGPLAPVQVGTTTKLVNGGTATGAGFINRSLSLNSNEIQVFAGARSDPQFFDYCDFQKIFSAGASPTAFSACSGAKTSFGSGPNPDFFASANVLSIVVEIPKSLLANGGNGVVAYWATTSTNSGS